MGIFFLDYAAIVQMSGRFKKKDTHTLDFDVTVKGKSGQLQYHPRRRYTKRL
ncbi:MAG: hypothetical protein JRJ77_03305 [Deltaproteobacteria bacterium]|nr:hypothetical protein [Deltaproteobacteria bacterium]